MDGEWETNVGAVRSCAETVLCMGRLLKHETQPSAEDVAKAVAWAKAEATEIGKRVVGNRPAFAPFTASEAKRVIEGACCAALKMVDPNTYEDILP